jgi:hypothetical protein
MRLLVVVTFLLYLTATAFAQERTAFYGSSSNGDNRSTG